MKQDAIMNSTVTMTNSSLEVLHLLVKTYSSSAMRSNNSADQVMGHEIPFVLIVCASTHLMLIHT